jgi:flagellin
MPLHISTNQAADKANYYLGKNADNMQKALTRLASGKRLTSPVEDPGNLAVSMKLSASINRLAGAMNNTQNAVSFMEVQDGMLETVGKILDRMSELKGLGSQDPMKSESDIASYNNEFKDLQVQLYAISQEKFNGVSLFANYSNGATVAEAVYKGKDGYTDTDNTLSIFTSTQGSAGAKVSIHKSLLLSALTVGQDLDIGKTWSSATNSSASATSGNRVVTFASDSVEGALNLSQISVGVITTALENISFLRAQNGGTNSRLSFAYESLSLQKTNMKAALGRIVDADIAEESTKLAKYNVLAQGAASMIAQANSTTDIALMLLR